MTALYTLPPHAPFISTLAQAIWDTAGRDADALHHTTILLPTQRAVRAMGHALVRVSGRGALVLPTLRAIGDLAPDEAPLESPELSLALPPAVSAQTRLFVLARLILAQQTAVGMGATLPQALGLARSLATLLDSAAYAEDADLARAADLVDGPFAAHWQQSALFLSILSTAWPAWLASQQRMDPAVRRMAVIRALADHWRASPPPGPVWMAGSTGALPAVADLIAMVARLPQGRVVLRGLDQDLDDRAWDCLDDGHPQMALKQLLDRMGVGRAAVQSFPGVVEHAPQRARRRLLAAALTPVAASDDWPTRIDALRAEGVADRDPIALGAEGLALLVAGSEDIAATGIALHMRHALETPQARVALITPDANLSTRVQVALQRWQIDAATTVGTPLLQTEAAQWGLALLDLCRDPTDPLALISVLQAPWLGFSDEDLYALDRDLRGLRPIDPAQMEARLNNGRAEALYGQICASDMTQSEPLPVADQATHWVQLMHQISDATQIWGRADGAVLAEVIRSLRDAGDVLPPQTPEGFRALVAQMLTAASVPPPSRPDARVQIMGTLEGRFAEADVIILAGLEDGVWPHTPEPDVFLSRPMRRALGLPAVEHRIGLSAHDFAQAAAHPQVLLVHTQRRGANPTKASRWLWRLQTLLQGAGLDVPTAQPLAGWITDLNAPSDLPPAPRPAPRPPTAVRPRQLKVTAVETLKRDPYAIYARQILGLRPWDDINTPFDARHRGNLWHAVLEHVPPGVIDAATRQDLLQRFTEALTDFGCPPVRHQREMWQFTAVLDAISAHQAGQPMPRQSVRERRGALELPTPHGPVLLRGTVDRLDVFDDHFVVLDYKTGEVPSDKMVRTGLSPQLPLMAAMAMAGQFGVQALPASCVMQYWKVGGPRRLVVSDVPAADHAVPNVAWQDTVDLVTAFLDANHPYTPRTSMKKELAVSDYDGLSRHSEWLRDRGGEDGVSEAEGNDDA